MERECDLILQDILFSASRLQKLFAKKNFQIGKDPLKELNEISENLDTLVDYIEEQT